MNIQEQLKRQEVKQLRGRLLRSRAAYVETIGRHDDAQLPYSPLYPTRVMRLVLGATRQMPFRALSYAAAALEAAAIVGTDQVQIVHANHVGEKINGISRETAGEQARLFGDVLLTLCQQSYPQFEGRILHAIDTPCDTDQFSELVQTTLDESPLLSDRLRRKGMSHNGDAIRYTAAHYAFQDTDLLQLDPLNNNAPVQTAPDTLISIGAMSEKPFYEVRMGMRKLGQDALTLASAQIFTKHLLPPYFVARNGEPLITDQEIAKISDPVAARDIAHFLQTHPRFLGENI